MPTVQLKANVPVATESSVKAPLTLARHLNELGRAVARIATDQNLNGNTLGSNIYGLYSARPSAVASPAGTKYMCSDGVVEFVSTGSMWRPLIGGVPGTEVAPSNSLSSWTKVGTAFTSVSLAGGCPYVVAPNNAGSSNVIGYETSKSGAKTFTVALSMQPAFDPASIGNVDRGRASIWVRDTATGKLVQWSYGNETAQPARELVAYNLSSLTAWVATPYQNAVPSASVVWLRLRCTSTSIICGFSFDGRNFVEPYTDAVTYLGASNTGNVFGFGVNNGYACSVTFLSAAVS